jgi:dTDP-4-amino-4,6-dideoxygalactose transaminase
LGLAQIDLVRQYQDLRQELEEALGQVLASGQFVMGKWVREVEAVVADLMGARHGIGVASGTDALDLALMAAGVGPDDEVITSPFSFVSVAEVALRMGARPVFVDIDARTFNLDPQQVEAALGERTKAVVPVHLYGQSADMDPIINAARQKSVAVIEDAAQAIGAQYKSRPVGSMGAMACLSFYPTKNLGCYGDGGMVLTNDDTLADRVAALRKHGQVEKYKYKWVGINSRLDSLQAAILLVKARRIKEWNERRRQVAALYDQILQDLPVETPYVADYAYHVFHQYTIQVDDRDRLRAFLGQREIGTAVHYPLGLHLQEAYQCLGYARGDFPNCDRAAQRVLSLPMFPELRDEEVEWVGGCIREFFGKA